eukprot:3098003-Pleurochrysis_carterae.AAC.1
MLRASKGARDNPCDCSRGIRGRTTAGVFLGHISPQNTRRHIRVVVRARTCALTRRHLRRLVSTHWNVRTAAGLQMYKNLGS